MSEHIQESTDSGTDAQRAMPIWILSAAVVAIVLSGISLFLAHRAGSVTILANPGSLDTAPYRSQLEEIRRSNDRILAAIWGTLGIATTLGVLLVGYNFARGERVLTREQDLLKREIEGTVETRIMASERMTDQVSNQLGTALLDIEALQTSAREMVDRLCEEKRKRASVQFELHELQEIVQALRVQVGSMKNDLPPLMFERAYGSGQPP